MNIDFIFIKILIFSATISFPLTYMNEVVDWGKEETIVKQSMSSMIGGFIGPIISLILGVLTFIIPSEYNDIFKIFITLLLSIITIYLYKYNNANCLEKL